MPLHMEGLSMHRNTHNQPPPPPYFYLLSTPELIYGWLSSSSFSLSRVLFVSRPSTLVLMANPAHFYSLLRLPTRVETEKQTSSLPLHTPRICPHPFLTSLSLSLNQAWSWDKGISSSASHSVESVSTESGLTLQSVLISIRSSALFFNGSLISGNPRKVNPSDKIPSLSSSNSLSVSIPSGSANVTLRLPFSLPCGLEVSNSLLLLILDQLACALFTRPDIWSQIRKVIGPVWSIIL